MACCTYCGAYDGNHRDHVIPVSYTSIKRNYSVGQIVPSCCECNSTLGDRMYVTVPERAAFLFNVYSVKYRTLLDMPTWTEDELSEMSINFQKQIKRRILQQTIIKERGEFLL